MRCTLRNLLLLATRVTAVPHEHHGHQHDRRTDTLNAQDILNKGITALGGEAALKALKGVSSHAYLYRSQTLEESVTPNFPDNYIATAGSLVMSYDLSGGPDDIVQRLDKNYAISEYWYFGRPQLDPVNASIVTRSGVQGYSCYVVGNEAVYTPTQVPFGYTDPALAKVLLRDAIRLYPKLLLGFKATPVLTASMLDIKAVKYPALTDQYLNITVAFEPSTYLPYIIRAYENHAVYGNSTSDFILYNYTSVAGVMFPRRYHLMYNLDSLLLDFLVGDIEVNPNFPNDYFHGLPASEIKNTALQIPPTPAMASPEYSDAEVFENNQNLLWYGGYAGKLSNITVYKPVPELPGLYHLSFNDAPGYATTIAVMDNAIMVVDAPAHQSKLVIQYVQQTFNRNVTHLLVTHHHHDHNYGAADYVAIGAKLVVPEDYKYYWSRIPNVKFAAATEDMPFIHRSKNMQVRGVWPGAQDVHANDWMYFTFTVRCPTDANTLNIAEADAWSPYFVSYEFNQQAATAWTAIMRRHQVAYNNTQFPIHGPVTPATVLYSDTGYDYPPYKVTDFIPGGPWC